MWSPAPAPAPAVAAGAGGMRGRCSIPATGRKDRNSREGDSVDLLGGTAREADSAGKM